MGCDNTKPAKQGLISPFSVKSPPLQEKIIISMLDYIDGIECYYWTHTKEQREFYINFAKKNNLIITGGTDHHGGERERIGQLEIDDSVMNQFN